MYLRSFVFHQGVRAYAILRPTDNKPAALDDWVAGKKYNWAGASPKKVSGVMAEDGSIVVSRRPWAPKSILKKGARGVENRTWWTPTVRVTWDRLYHQKKKGLVGSAYYKKMLSKPLVHAQNCPCEFCSHDGETEARCDFVCVLLLCVCVAPITFFAATL